MPKTRRTLDEQLAALKQKKEALEKQLNAVETRKKETDRKLETRRKIIVGGALITHAEIDPEFRRAMQAALQKAVAPKDRALVADLIRSGVADAATPPADSGAVAGDKTAAAKETAPPVPTRPTRPGPQPPGTRPPGPGQSG
jgi:membrane peptidoglycan carboxypeptidase